MFDPATMAEKDTYADELALAMLVVGGVPVGPPPKSEKSWGPFITTFAGRTSCGEP